MQHCRRKRTFPWPCCEHMTGMPLRRDHGTRTRLPYLVRRRLGGIVLVVQVARDVEEAAVAAGDPQVGAARVEHHHEVLRGCPQADLAIVLQRALPSLQHWAISSSSTPGPTWQL